MSPTILECVPSRSIVFARAAHLLSQVPGGGLETLILTSLFKGVVVVRIRGINSCGLMRLVLFELMPVWPKSCFQVRLRCILCVDKKQLALCLVCEKDTALPLVPTASSSPPSWYGGWPTLLPAVAGYPIFTY